MGLAEVFWEHWRGCLSVGDRIFNGKQSDMPKEGRVQGAEKENYKQRQRSGKHTLLGRQKRDQER